ncbi:MAG TPA: hypothetical protein VHA07_01455 [Devosia sp.]|nr:hypothetical protein [Devosia sp.]
MADAFVALQKLRHDADYDPVADFTRRDVQSHILLAENSISKLLRSPLKDRRAFVVWLLFPNRR